MLLQSQTLNKQEALQSGYFVKRNNRNFTKVGALYKTDLDKRKAALSETVSLEPRPLIESRLSVEYWGLVRLLTQLCAGFQRRLQTCPPAMSGYIRR